MTYNPNKPDARPSPALDAATIQTNFAQFAAAFATNHIALNSAFQGAHSTVIFENLSLDPGVDQNLTVLYNKDASSRAGAQPQLFIQIPKFLPTRNDTTNAENFGMQLTYNTVNTSGPIYQSFLPGGYLVYFGTVTGNTVSNATLAIPVTVSPTPTRLLVAFATSNTMNSSSTPAPLTANTVITAPSTGIFTIYSNSNGSRAPIPYSFGWLAIGTA